MTFFVFIDFFNRLSPVDKMADILKVKPLVFDTGQSAYHGIGERIGKAFSVGKKEQVTIGSIPI